jgi:hypothetical protein
MTTSSQQSKNMSNDDIIAIARSIREEDNSQLHVRPWKSSRRRIAWYVALPAACVISFILGYCLRPTPHADTPHELTAQTATDTVYLREVVYDTVYQTTSHDALHLHSTSTSSQPTNKEPRKIGISVLEDNIRYDLLAASHEMHD